MKKMTGSMLLASALTLGAIMAPSILAATTSVSTSEEISQDAKTALDELRAQEKAGEITHEEAHAKMEELGFDRPFGKGGPHKELTDEQQAQLDSIRTQVEAGTLTEEDARTQMEELGFDRHGGPGHLGKGPLGNIDEETRTAIEGIRDQFKTDKLTEDEAQAKLDDLDVDLPEDFLTHVHFKDLDEKTQAALTEIREQFGAGDLTEAQAQTKVEALGLDFDAKLLSRGPHEKLTDEQKEQLDTIREQVEAGTLTEEAARSKIEELGFEPHGGPGRHGHGGPHGDFQQEDAPVDDEAEATSTTSEA